jgi:hypothetical protein
MIYKEALFFVAKCLTISLEDNNRQEIEKQLKSKSIDWDAVVKVSTAHYVFPALYCNLKRVDLLKYLPQDLVAYMMHITELNRDRNLKIIEQAKKLNKLLLANNITPIFLKGTGNLLEGLYNDIAERMVGDIDFVVSKEHYPRAIEILLKNKYKTKIKEKYLMPFRHYPRLTKFGEIAAIEIHSKLVIDKYTHEFNYNVIHKEFQKTNDVFILSFEHQLALSIIAKQINDSGIHYKDIALRNAYDVFLLSKKVNAKETILKFNTLKKHLNSFLAVTYITFGEPSSLKYEITIETDEYLIAFNDLLLDEKKYKSRRKILDKKLFVKNKISNLYKFLVDKNYRDWKLNKEFHKLTRNDKTYHS